MPIGILFIMRNPLPKFPSAAYLNELIATYFTYIEVEASVGENQDNEVKEKSKQKSSNKQPEPATITGLALHLGFNSREQFEQYETKGKFATCIKRARLQIETIYEKKLHQQSSAAGAIFALKALGWNEKAESKNLNTSTIKTLRVTIIECGPKPAGSEKEVDL